MLPIYTGSRTRPPVAVIEQVVWLYHRFGVSLRDVEEMMLARGVVVSHETVRSCEVFLT